MEREIWKGIVARLKEMRSEKVSVHHRYPDLRILQVWVWSVVHDRPMRWACQRRNWPLDLRRSGWPSESTMSRRLRSIPVRAWLQAIEQRVNRREHSGNLLWFIDGKPLVIGPCSKDRQAGYGRASRGMAKGYKLHAILGKDGSVATWRIAPMNKDERVMGTRLLRVAPIQGYVLGDSNYDSNKLHEVCDQRGNLQLVVPRRYGPNHGHGHRRQTPGRLRSKELLENPASFGRTLFLERSQIERYFGGLSGWGGGLTHLPPWVRTHRRVWTWVQAKLIINAVKRDLAAKDLRRLVQ